MIITNIVFLLLYQLFAALFHCQKRTYIFTHHTFNVDVGTTSGEMDCIFDTYCFIYLFPIGAIYF